MKDECKLWGDEVGGGGYSYVALWFVFVDFFILMGAVQSKSAIDLW